MLDRPFRGSDAVARGLVTPGELRGPRFRSLFRGVHVLRSDTEPDLLTWSRAAFLLLGEHGALAGYSAAEMLGAACAPRGAPPEIVAPGTGVRPRSGLIVHRDVLRPAEVWQARGCRVTSPLRTAWDLGRRLERSDAVVAIDALARRGRFDPAELLSGPGVRAGARHCRRLAGIVALCDSRAESPMESRLRLLLHDHGLPTPDVQFSLLDGDGYLLARFDLAYPAARIAVEYDGEEFHRQRRGADNHRDVDVAALDWETVRVEAADVFVTPDRTAHRIRRLLDSRSPSR